MFAVAHLDFAPVLWPCYVAVAAIYGMVAYLTDSILPAIVLHTAGNLYSNFDLWLHGQAEWQAPATTAGLIWDTGADRSFWVSLCALLRPKGEIPTDALYYAGYLLSRERWRSAYARKFGKTRINRTTLYAPARAGRPDFEKMARIVRATAAYPIVKSFRDALAIRPKATHAA